MLLRFVPRGVGVSTWRVVLPSSIHHNPSRSFSSLPPQLLGHTFGLPDVDAPLRHYRSTVSSSLHDYTAPALITHLIERVRTEQYVLSWEQHLRSKMDLGKDQLTDEEIVRDMDYCRLWAGLSYEVSDISIHSMEIIQTERIHKRFIIMNEDNTRGIRAEMTWNMEKNKLPGATLYGYKATCDIQIIQPQTTKIQPTTSHTEQEPVYTLFNINDYANPTFDHTTWERIITTLNMSSMRVRDTIWFWSSLVSHPSDYAFDMISGVMEQELQKRT